jgi:hypothetical protein
MRKTTLPNKFLAEQITFTCHFEPLLARNLSKLGQEDASPTLERFLPLVEMTIEGRLFSCNLSKY